MALVPGGAGTGVMGGAGLGAAGSTVGMAGSTAVVPGAGVSGGAGTTAMVGGSGGMGDVMGAGTGAAGMDVAGAGAAGTEGTAGTEAPGGYKPPCLTDGSEMLTVGDSWVNYTYQLNPDLADRARADGALAADDQYLDYSFPGSALVAGGLGGLIGDQWDSAKRANPNIKFVVMDGGGNDVLLGAPQCLTQGSASDPGCQQVVKDATEEGRRIQADMKASGVKQGIYFFYPHVPAGGWDMLDYALPMAQSVCEGMNDDTYHCTFVDTRPHFPENDSGPTPLIQADGIHPNAAGQKVLADLIWKTMKDNCMAQPESSGCCTPQ